MREPLAEFSELLVATLTGERLADSPVQKSHQKTDGLCTEALDRNGILKVILSRRGKVVYET